MQTTGRKNSAVYLTLKVHRLKRQQVWLSHCHFGWTYQASSGWTEMGGQNGAVCL